MKARIQRFITVSLTCIVFAGVGLVAACGRGEDRITNTPQSTLGASATEIPSSATPTVTQTPLPTATPRMPYEDYLSLDLPEGAIARLGKGAIYDVALAPDGSSIALATSIGVYRYALDSETELLQEMWFLPTNMPMTSVAFSPDGETLAVGSYNNYLCPKGAEKLELGSAYIKEPAVLLIDVASGLPLQVFQQGDSTDDMRISRLVFSPNGTHLAVASFSDSFFHNIGGFDVFNIGDGTSTKELDEPADDVEWWDSLDSLAFSPDGAILATGLGLMKSNSENGINKVYEVYTWDLASADLLSRLTGFEENISSLAFSPDGTTLASGTDDGTAVLWNTEDWSTIRTLYGSGNPVDENSIVSDLRSHSSVLEFSSDGSTLATGASDGTVKLWNTANGSSLGLLDGHETALADFAFSADGSEILTVSYDGDTQVHNLSSGTSVKRYKLAGHEVSYGVEISADGQILSRDLRDGWITLHDVDDPSVLYSFSGERPVFSTDGKMLAITAPNNSIQVRDTTSGEVKFTFSGHSDEIKTVTFSPDGTVLASGSADTSIILWDVDSGVRRYRLWGHSETVYELAFSPEGNTLASEAGDSAIMIWDVASGRRLIEFKYAESDLELGGFMYDGDYLVCLRITYPDHEVILLDPTTGDLIDSIYTEPTTYRIDIAPDDSMLVTSTFFYGSQIIPFGVSSDFRYPQVQITGPGIAFSSDGELGAYSSFWDVVLWDPASGASINQFSGHNAEVVDLAFSEEAGILASASYDGTILLWIIAP